MLALFEVIIMKKILKKFLNMKYFYVLIGSVAVLPSNNAASAAVKRVNGSDVPLISVNLKDITGINRT